MAAGVDFGKYKRIVQYFWDPEPKNDDPERNPIWCLGREYTCGLQTGQSESFTILPSPSTGADSSAGSSTPPTVDSQDDGLAYSSESSGAPPSGEEKGWPGAFLDDFESRLWFTYRSNFAPIPKSHDPQVGSNMTLAVRLRSQLVDHDGFTTDSGWGCMIRSGQSLLGNALGMLQLGRDWRRGEKAEQESSLLSLFADDPSAPFSIHRFVSHGAEACGKHPGEWFGPSATARCIQALCNAHDTNLRVYVTGDGSDVYEDSFMQIAKPATSPDVFHPTLILVGIRLGIESVTPVYRESLKAALCMSQSIGIAGGRPSSSHYFVATQGPHLFYLDPHQTRSALKTPVSPEDVDSCHTRRLRRIHIREMDPSMLIAFLIRDENDWRAWRSNLAASVTGKGKSVIRVADHATSPDRGASPREAALDEVEILSSDDETIGA